MPRACSRIFHEGAPSGRGGTSWGEGHTCTAGATLYNMRSAPLLTTNRSLHQGGDVLGPVIATGEIKFSLSSILSLSRPKAFPYAIRLYRQPMLSPAEVASAPLSPGPVSMGHTDGLGAGDMSAQARTFLPGDRRIQETTARAED
jgi:hypothetical protein